MSVTYLQ